MTNYEKMGSELGRLVELKQAAYGDSFGQSGDVMRILYPSGIKPEQLDDALAIVRVIDKLFRIATNKDALGESPWRDVAGYALLGMSRSWNAECLCQITRTQEEFCKTIREKIKLHQEETCQPE